MQRWREQYLGLAEFLPAMAIAEVDQFFTLSRGELTAVESRRGPLNRLSVGLQIGFLRMTGRTLNSCQILPTAVLEHLGRQLDLTPPQLASIRGLYRRKRTLFDVPSTRTDGSSPRRRRSSQTLWSTCKSPSTAPKPTNVPFGRCRYNT